MLETVIFKNELRRAGLESDIDGTETVAVLVDRDELDWYVSECLEPSQVQTFIKLLSESWHPVGTVSRDVTEPDEDSYLSDSYGAVKRRFSDHFYIENPSYYSVHFG